MAENVFAVTQTPVSAFPNTFTRGSLSIASLDRDPSSYALKADRYVSSGRILRNTEIRVMTGDGMRCGDAVPGIIEIRSGSLFSGYWSRTAIETQSIAH